MLDLEHVPNFEEFGVKIGPSFFEYKHPFSTPIQQGNGFAKPYNFHFLIGVSMHTETTI